MYRNLCEQVSQMGISGPSCDVAMHEMSFYDDVNEQFVSICAPGILQFKFGSIAMQCCKISVWSCT